MLAQFHHLLVLDVAFSDLEWIEPELFSHFTTNGQAAQMLTNDHWLMLETVKGGAIDQWSVG